MLLFLYCKYRIYYDSRTVPRTKSYSHTSKAAAVLRRARSMYLHCTALPSESQMPKSIQSKPREMANEHSRQQAHQCGAK